MKNVCFKALIGLILWSALSLTSLRAQEALVSRWSIEIDPATYVFNGYAAHLRWQPKGSDRLNLGVGVYAMDFPDPLVNINPDNRDQGWTVRLSTGIGLFGEYHLREVNRGWFVGEQIGWQQYRLGLDPPAGHRHFASLLFMTYGGYAWQPFAFPLYIKPWAGIGYTTKVAGSTTLGDRTYQLMPLTFFATLHLGYRF